MNTQTIDSDIKQAMIAKDALKVSTLRMVKASLTNLQKDRGVDGVLTDEDVVAVFRKEVKKRQDSYEAFRGAGRSELADKEEAEIAILSAYLPAAMPADELSEIVKAAISELGATSRKEMGAVIKLVSSKVQGRTDGKTISTVVQGLLSATR